MKLAILLFLVIAGGLVLARIKNRSIRTGISFVLILIAVTVFWQSGSDFLGSVFARIETGTGHFPVWGWLVLVSLVAGVILTFFRRSAGFATLRVLAVFWTVAGGLLLIQERFGNGRPWTESAASSDKGCSSAPFDRNHIISARKDFVLLGADKRYTIFVPAGRERDFRIEFADAPLEGQPSMNLGNVQDFVSVAYYGDGSKLANGLTVGSVRVQTNRLVYQRRVNNRCLGYYVYLEN